MDGLSLPCTHTQYWYVSGYYIKLNHVYRGTSHSMDGLSLPCTHTVLVCIRILYKIKPRL